MARFPGFIGGTGALAALAVNAERTLNWYPELAGQSSTNTAWLRPTPGLTLFCTLGAGPIRTIFYQDGRAFALSNDRFYEFFADGTFIQRGTVNADTRPGSIFSNGGAVGRQLFIVSGSAGYIFALDTNVLTVIVAAGFPPSALMGAFADQYFLALFAGTPAFAFSALANGLAWAALDVAQKSQTSDNLIAMIYDHKELWLLGSKTTEVWADTGDLNTPWSPKPLLIEGGIAAQDSWAKGDDSIFWIRGNEQGSRKVVRASGYDAQPIGSQAMHTAMNGYSRIDDALGWFYEDEGHGFYMLSFPTANATWCYDVTTQLWHERSYLNPATGLDEAFLGRCHAFAFDGTSSKHLVGSRVDGAIYQMTSSVFTDNGHPIRRVRTAPHLNFELNETSYDRLEVLMKTGIGVSSGGQGTDPQIWLQYSDDGGETWTSELWASMGPYQQFQRRVFWTRLGSAQDRVFRITTTDPVFCGLIDASLDFTPGAS